MSLANIVFWVIISIVGVGLIVLIPFTIKWMKEFDRAMERIDHMCKNPIWKW